MDGDCLEREKMAGMSPLEVNWEIPFRAVLQPLYFRASCSIPVNYRCCPRASGSESPPGTVGQQCSPLPVSGFKPLFLFEAPVLSPFAICPKLH